MGLSKHSQIHLFVMPNTPKLYSYIVARDYGFAPNPFYGFCTLATCKPKIRKAAQVGDWVVGTGSKTKGRNGRIVYAMRVTETMTFDEYWRDFRFYDKRPGLYSSRKKAYGDNIYHRENAGSDWGQLDSHHSFAYGGLNIKNKDNDTKANRVLISNDFVYWGGDGPRIPSSIKGNICHTTQNHKSNFQEHIVREFINWIDSLDDTGYCGVPLEWTKGDQLG